MTTENERELLVQQMYNATFSAMEKILVACLRDMGNLKREMAASPKHLAKMRELLKLAKEFQHRINEDMD